jgi:hypothetical protein
MALQLWRILIIIWAYPIMTYGFLQSSSFGQPPNPSILSLGPEADVQKAEEREVVVVVAPCTRSFSLCLGAAKNVHVIIVHINIAKAQTHKVKDPLALSCTQKLHFHAMHKRPSPCYAAAHLSPA